MCARSCSPFTAVDMSVSGVINPCEINGVALFFEYHLVQFIHDDVSNNQTPECASRPQTTGLQW